MTQVFIILINLLVLCIGGHMWEGLKSVYARKGLSTVFSHALIPFLLLSSGTVMANNFLLNIAEVAQTAP